MTLTRHLACMFCCCALLLGTPAHALTFDEDFADNFTEITVEGIKFTADPAGFADFGTGFWLGADFVSGAALEVSQGASVIIDLPAPASFLQFGAAVGEDVVLTDLATILAYDGAGLQVFPVSIEAPLFGGGLGDAERRFGFLGGGVRKVVVSYEQSFGFSVLAIDNLVYQPIPEPATWMLLLAGSALVIARRARSAFLA